MGKFVDRDGLRNVNWHVWQEDDGKYGNDAVMRAIMLDIREELKRLNRVLNCPNFIEVPAILRAIKQNTKKRRKPKAVGKPKLRVVR